MKTKLWIAILALLMVAAPETSFAMGLTDTKFPASTLHHLGSTTLSISWISRQFQQLIQLGNTLPHDQLLVLLIALFGPALQLLMVYLVLINQVTRRIRNFIHRHIYLPSWFWFRPKVQPA